MALQTRAYSGGRRSSRPTPSPLIARDRRSLHIVATPELSYYKRVRVACKAAAEETAAVELPLYQIRFLSFTDIVFSNRSMLESSTKF